ncbi:MAG: beta-ketoacyl synthase N-terminal-like domain-containing protein [Pirellulaceae bacterium]
MRDSDSSRRVVITGVGLVSPLGNQVDTLWESLRNRKSGVSLLQSPANQALPIPCGAEAKDFTGGIDDFGPLDKALQRSIKKGLKLMCREIEMGWLRPSWRCTIPGSRRTFAILIGQGYSTAAITS